MIPKNNKQVRIVVDYCQLNKYLKQYPHHMPRVKELFTQIGLLAPQYFSSLDIIMGTHALLLRKTVT
jgi:hypothetical protein